MIERKDLLALEFYKSRPFKGSDKGIRYMLSKEADEDGADIFVAYIWPEPFSFECTEDEKKGSEKFEFSEEGMCKAVEWLNEKHDDYALAMPKD
jgi:hypothetical protein